MKNKNQRLRQISLVIAILMALPTMMFAQALVQVRGTVVDSQGVPMVGVSVYSQSGRTGATTSIDGTYSFNAPKDSEITFHFMGFISQSIKLPDNGVLNVTMVEDAVALEEVVVTGYGTYTKAAYAGSASVIKPTTLKDTPMGSVTQMFQGMAAGVTSTVDASGQPGAPMTVRIRGVGSYSASNSPLYVIDGVPVTSGDIGSVGTAGTDIMATLNSSDIENISIIKDAAAASLYGSRAANGVVIITTKQGKLGKAQFNFKADMGFSDFALFYRPYIDGDERREFLYDAMLRKYNYQMTPAQQATNVSAQQYADNNIDRVAPIPWSGWTDWNDALFRKGSYSNYELSASGATESVNFFGSLSIREQEGIQRMQDLNTIQGRVNVKYKATKRLELGVNSMFSTLSQNVGYDGMEYNSPIYGSRHKVTASDAIYNQNGTYNRSLLSNGKYNAVAVLDNDINRQYVTRAFNIIYGTYSILPELKFTTRVGHDYTITKAVTWADPSGSSDWVTAGSSYKQLVERQRTTWQNNITYNKTFQSKHNVEALAGYEIERIYSDYASATARGFINANKHEISSGALPYSVGGYASESRLVSYLAKANYNYENRYFFGASYRLDGTSRLRPENRWGHFWSLSGAWRFMDESFVQPIRDILTDGKLRLSYGVNGTQPSGYYAGYNMYDYGADYNLLSGQLEGSLVSDFLVWESNHNFNIGLDLTFIDRISTTIELYNRVTKDLTFASPVSRTTGVSSVLSNIGSFRNQGIELDITSQNISRRDFSWTTNFNISHNKNRVLKLSGETDEIVSGRFKIKEGYDRFTTFLVEFCDINPDNGFARFYKNTELADGTIDRTLTEKFSEATRVMGKITTPKVFGGLTNSFQYKMFDLSFTLTYTLGGYSFDNAAQKSREAGRASAAAINQIPLYYRDSWKQPGDIAQYEGWFYTNTNGEMVNASTAHLHSTDHLRLKNFTIGATLPKNIVNRVGLSKVRLYASGVNMLTWVKWDQYDPETPYDGVVGYATPPLKTITFGLEIGF